MKRMDLKEANIQTLVQTYRECTEVHATASFGGDYETANENADAVIEIYRELRRRGREAQNAILPLLNDNDPNVRVMAAYHSLEFAPEKGEPVLLELSKRGTGLHRLTAEVCLEQWKNGSLSFP